MSIKRSDLFSFLLFSLLLSAILAGFCFLGFRFIDQKTQTTATIKEPALTVVLDAGHGGEDGGTSGYGLVEKDLNLDIVLTVGQYLSKCGIPVVYTRTEDILLYDKNGDYHGHKKSMDLATRLSVARQTQNPVFISIHMNAYPSSSCRGLQVYYSKNNESSLLLSQSIQNSVVANLQPYNHRKVKMATSSIFLLDRIEDPAILVECGFLSNEEDCALLSDPEYKQRLSFVIACTVAQYCKSS